MEWETWVSNSIGDLLKNTVSTKDPSPLQISQNLSFLVETISEGNIAAFSRSINIPKNTFWLWCKGKNLPSLNALLKICYYINISVADFITENLINKEFSTRSLPFHTQKSRQRAGNPKLDRDKVKKLLEAILEDNQSTPLSMPQVAQAINYEVKTIYNNFPELYRKISAKYTDYKKSTFLKKIEKCCQEVREAAFELHRRGGYPSEARISELISHPGHLRYKKVRDAVKKARQELGINQLRK